MKILIGGDFAPTDSNKYLFEKNDKRKIYTNELLSYLSEFDFRIYDFECVFSGEGSPNKKFGPYIDCSPKCMPGILASQPSLMVLANNHINNLGSKGIKNTIDIFKNNHIPCVGAGLNLKDSSEPYIINRDGISVGIYACAENEFNVASEISPGVNGYDPLRTFGEIRELKKQCNYVIVIYHGGIIEYRYPLPNEQRVLRKMVDYGADLVVGQHTHCIGCYEEYKNRTIIYGQGDFLFARPTHNQRRYSGLFIAINVDEKGFRLSYKVRVKPNNTIRLADEDEERLILDQFNERSKEILQKSFIQQKFQEYSGLKSDKYLTALLGRKKKSIIFRGMNKLSGHRLGNCLLRRVFSENDMLCLQDFLLCESHQEIMFNLIKKWGKYEN